MPYFHFVFALPAVIGAMAYQNKAKLYGLLFKAASETLITIAADCKHLGAEIGIVAVLHTWGQNLQHHPHVHCVVRVAASRQTASVGLPAGRILLPVRVLSRLFRRLFLEGLMAAFEAGELSSLPISCIWTGKGICGRASAAAYSRVGRIRQKGPLLAPSSYWLIWLGTPTALRSPMIGCLGSMKPTSAYAGKRPGKAAVISAK